MELFLTFLTKKHYERVQTLPNITAFKMQLTDNCYVCEIDNNIGYHETGDKACLFSIISCQPDSLPTIVAIEVIPAPIKHTLVPVFMCCAVLLIARCAALRHLKHIHNCSHTHSLTGFS